MTTSYFVELKNINKTFGKNVVIDDLSLQVEKGEMISILGPSGCGKTTILRLLAGLEQPTSGAIYINGEDVTKRSIQERDISMVFQSYALFPHMSLGENVGYGLKMLGVGKKEREKRVSEILEIVDLAGFENRYVDQISGGQQQRVALARALILQPKVLLFDEPLSNLDTNLRRSMREKIRELQQQFGITSFYVTHDQSEAFAVSDRVLVMRKGEIMQFDTPENLYRAPNSEFIANFMGDANIFKGHYDAKTQQLEVNGYRITLDQPLAREDGACHVGIRPEAISLKAHGEESQACHIEHVVYMGASYEVMVNWQGQILFLEVNSIGEAPKLDQTYYLHIATRGIFAL